MGSFGYHPASAANFESFAGSCVALRKSAYTYAADGTETVTRLWFYGWAFSGSPTCDIGLYTVTSGDPSARVLVATVTVPAIAGWVSVDVSQALTAGTTYMLAAGNVVGGPAGVGYFADENSVVGDGCKEAIQALPDPFGTKSDNAYAYALYAEYTATGGPAPHYTRRRLEGGMIGMG